MESAILISHIALWLILFGLAFLLLGSLHAQGVMTWRLTQLEATTPSRVGRSGLKPGTKAPDFTLPSVAGSEVSLDDFAGRRVLLVFVQTGCGPCHDIAPELNRLAVGNCDVQMLVINNAEPEQAREYAREVRAQFPVLVQEKWSVSRRYEVFATPFAFLIDELGIVAAKGIVTSKEHLGFLISSAPSRAAGNGKTFRYQNALEVSTNVEDNLTDRRELSNLVSLSAEEVHHV